MNYLVKWEINIEANTPEEAAVKARAIQLDSQSFATVFEVWNEDRLHKTTVDLDNPA
jgi:hypothetical protein